jgi:AraC family transcriptional regulator of adaptative response / DNA-3-methyladenine glycosylase II
MRIDTDACYRAVKTRDARFDGRFFTGVITTGIYCRPICPAPTPRRKNCRFFACAAAAQEAGFRPCLRCRPEIAPGFPAFNGTSATLSRALRLIAEGALDEASVERLALRLGIGERHLRRLFDEQLGASPVVVAGTRRFLLAKKLLTETALPVTDICYAAGFSSVRRFNDVMRAAYGRTPRELRGKFAVARGRAIRLTLPFRPPYNWAALMRFLALRAIPGVELVTPESYRRTFALGQVEVKPEPKNNHLVAYLELSNIRELGGIVERLRRLFDTDAPILDIEAHLSTDPRLANSVKSQAGLRVPGAWDPFELAIRAILDGKRRQHVGRAHRRQVRRLSHPARLGRRQSGRHRVAGRPGAVDPRRGGGLRRRQNSIRRRFPGTSGDWRLDRAIYRHASLRRAGCLPRDGPRIDPGRRTGCGKTSGSLAALAGLRRHAFMDGALI